MNDQAIEQEIQTKGLTAPRVTPVDIEEEIAGEYSFVVGDVLQHAPVLPSAKLLTICVLVLRNGFTVTGESACASPENFDAEIGRKIARQKAVEKIWPLLGFRLHDRLSRTSIEDAARRAHEINRAYCDAIGDTPQPSWYAAPEWQRESARDGVRNARSGKTPEELHESWLDHKRADGWTYGPEKDPERKTHPCMVPFAELPAKQRVKDYLFRAAVNLY